MPVMHNFKPQQLILTDDDKPAFVTLPLIVRLSLALIVGNRATRPYPNYKQYADYYARFSGFPSIGCNVAPCL